MTDAHTYIEPWLEPRTVVLHGGIPVVEVGNIRLVLRSNIVTSIAVLDVIELRTV